MIHFILMVVLYFGVVMFQAFFINAFVSPSFFTPNVVVFLSLVWILIYGFDEKILHVLILGFLYDSIFSESFGFGVLSLLLSCYGIALLSRRIVFERKLSGTLILSCFVLFSLFFFQWMTLFGREYVGFDSLYFREVFHDDIYFSFWNAVISLCSFWFLYRVIRYVFLKRFVRT